MDTLATLGLADVGPLEHLQPDSMQRVLAQLEQELARRRALAETATSLQAQQEAVAGETAAMASKLQTLPGKIASLRRAATELTATLGAATEAEMAPARSAVAAFAALPSPLYIVASQFAAASGLPLPVPHSAHTAMVKDVSLASPVSMHDSGVQPHEHAANVQIEVDSCKVVLQLQWWPDAGLLTAQVLQMELGSQAVLNSVDLQEAGPLHQALLVNLVPGDVGRIVPLPARGSGAAYGDPDAALLALRAVLAQPAGSAVLWPGARLGRPYAWLAQLACRSPLAPALAGNPGSLDEEWASRAANERLLAADALQSVSVAGVVQTIARRLAVLADLAQAGAGAQQPTTAGTKRARADSAPAVSLSGKAATVLQAALAVLGVDASASVGASTNLALVPAELCVSHTAVQAALSVSGADCAKGPPAGVAVSSAAPAAEPGADSDLAMLWDDLAEDHSALPPVAPGPAPSASHGDQPIALSSVLSSWWLRDALVLTARVQAASDQVQLCIQLPAGFPVLPADVTACIIPEAQRVTGSVPASLALAPSHTSATAACHAAAFALAKATATLSDMPGVADSVQALVALCTHQVSLALLHP